MSETEVRKKRKIEGGVDDPDPTRAFNALLQLTNLKILNDQQHCDLCFVVGPEKEKIWAHKCFLKVKSTYFEKMFSGRSVPGSSTHKVSSNEIVLEDVEPSIFRSFLKHIYAYVFKANTPMEALKLLSLAQTFGVEHLVKSCEKVLKPSQLDYLLEGFVLAKKLSLTNVVDKFGETMTNYFTQLANSPSFEKADEATLIYLLERNDLNVKESQLFLDLIRWADKQIESSVEDPKPERRDILKNLIPLVRFPTMSAQEFAQVVAPTNILRVQTDRLLLMYLISDETNREALARKLPFCTIPREKLMLSINFYEEKLKSEIGTFPKVALNKYSNIQDVLTIRVVAAAAASWRGQIISLVLELPKIPDRLLFQNSSEAASTNLTIPVAISFSETKEGDSQQTWISEEVPVNVGSGQMVLTLDKPWMFSFDKSKTYKITTRFLSDVSPVLEGLDDGTNETTYWRDENFDVFTGTTLGGLDVVLERSTPTRLHLFMSGGTTVSGVSGVTNMSLSSGFHLIRSMQVTRY